MVNVESGKAKLAINSAIDLFHRRWVLRIIWELRATALNFRNLQEACNEVSPSVLNQRLAELREVGLVNHVQGEGYMLSQQGQELLKAMRPMVNWAVGWRGGRSATPRRPRQAAVQKSRGRGKAGKAR